MTKWEYKSVHGKSNFYKYQEIGQTEWELVSVDGGTAYFKRPIVEDIEMSMEANAPLVENLEMKQEILDKLKVVSDGLEYIEGYFGDWQRKIKEVLGVIND